jgi:hypothetical protein
MDIFKEAEGIAAMVVIILSSVISILTKLGALIKGIKRKRNGGLLHDKLDRIKIDNNKRFGKIEKDVSEIKKYIMINKAIKKDRQKRKN